MKLQFFILLALCVAFNAGAHIMMKYAAMIREGFWARNINPLGAPQIPVLFGAAACSFAVSIVFYLLLLKTAQLSIAFSVLTSLNYIIIIMYSVFFFKEQLKPIQYSGLVLIFIGLFLLLLKFEGEKTDAPVPPAPEGRTEAQP